MTMIDENGNLRDGFPAREEAEALLRRFAADPCGLGEKVPLPDMDSITRNAPEARCPGAAGEIHVNSVFVREGSPRYAMDLWEVLGKGRCVGAESVYGSSHDERAAWHYLAPPNDIVALAYPDGLMPRTGFFARSGFRFGGELAYLATAVMDGEVPAGSVGFVAALAEPYRSDYIMSHDGSCEPLSAEAAGAPQHAADVAEVICSLGLVPDEIDTVVCLSQSGLGDGIYPLLSAFCSLGCQLLYANRGTGDLHEKSVLAPGELRQRHYMWERGEDDVCDIIYNGQLDDRVLDAYLDCLGTAAAMHAAFVVELVENRQAVVNPSKPFPAEVLERACSEVTDGKVDFASAFCRRAIPKMGLGAAKALAGWRGRQLLSEKFPEKSSAAKLLADCAQVADHALAAHAGKVCSFEEFADEISLPALVAAVAAGVSPDDVVTECPVVVRK